MFNSDLTRMTTKIPYRKKKGDTVREMVDMLACCLPPQVEPLLLCKSSHIYGTYTLTAILLLISWWNSYQARPSDYSKSMSISGKLR